METSACSDDCPGGRRGGVKEEETMKRIVSFVAPVMALVLAMAFSQMIRAEDKPATATGTVEVTVQDKDGKRVEGATVRVPATNKPARGAAKLADPPAPAEKPARPAPVAEGKTGADGKAKLKNVPAGDYNLAAN